MTWWLWVLGVGVVGAVGWGVTEMVLLSRWLRHTSLDRFDYERRLRLRRWMRFHGGLK